MLSSGANVNLKNKLGRSPLHMIVSSISNPSLVYLNMVSQFLNYNLEVTSPMPKSSTLLALFLDNSNILSTNPTANYSMGVEVQGFRCLSQFIDAGSGPNAIFDSQPLLNNCLEKGIILENHHSEEFILHLIQKPMLTRQGGTEIFLYIKP